MASYDIAYSKLKEDEGGFSLRSTDPGGFTYMGLTRKDNPGFASFNGFRGWDTVARWVAKFGGVGRAQGKIFPDEILNKNVKAYIFKNHWQRFKCDLINDQHLAAHVYDFCFNSGQGPKIINQAFKLDPVNIITEDTVNKINAGIPVLINAIIYNARIKYLKSLTMTYKGKKVATLAKNPGLLTRAESFKNYNPYGKQLFSFKMFWN